MFDIATRYMLYVRRECTGCMVPDFPIQAPIYLYSKTAVMCSGVMQTYIIFHHVMKTLYTCMHHKLMLMHSYTHMHIYYVSCTLVSGPVIKIRLLLRHVVYTRAVYAPETFEFIAITNNEPYILAYC